MALFEKLKPSGGCIDLDPDPDPPVDSEPDLEMGAEHLPIGYYMPRLMRFPSHIFGQFEHRRFKSLNLSVL